MSTIQVDHLTKQYGNGEAAVLAIRDIHFDIASGEWIAIMGESGSGKSTLLTVMGALNSPSQGKYRVDNLDVYALGQEERADFRRNYSGLCFPEFPSDPLSHRSGKRYAPADSGKNQGKEKRSHGPRGPWPGGVGCERKSTSQPDLRRRAGAGGHRPGVGEQAPHPPGR